MSRAVIPMLLALAGLLPASGCSIYDGRYVWEPRPVAVESVADDGTTSGRTLVTIVGRRKRPKNDLPVSLEMRLRTEGEADIEIEPESLRLVAADLRALPDPIIERGVLEDGGADADVVTAYFPLPDDVRPDLSSLRLDWTVRIDGARRPASATFTRKRIVYPYDPYWHSPYVYPYGGRRFGVDIYGRYRYGAWCY